MNQHKSRLEAPCYRCEKRILGCHSSCKSYRHWVEEHRKEMRWTYDMISARQHNAAPKSR